jgi:hypothetical protein
MMPDHHQEKIRRASHRLFPELDLRLMAADFAGPLVYPADPHG